MNMTARKLTLDPSFKDRAQKKLKKLDRSEFMDEFNDYKNKYILPEQS